VDEVIAGRPVVPGCAEGEVLASGEPLSFWGGYDPRSGEITDRRHPLSGAIAAGRILALPFSRGSSTTSAILLEAARAGTAPAALITAGADPFLALGAIVAREMYGVTLPVIAVAAEEFARLRTGDRLRVEADGSLRRQ
jgi:predicted aconitase with swiveling domain